MQDRLTTRINREYGKQKPVFTLSVDNMRGIFGSEPMGIHVYVDGEMLKHVVACSCDGRVDTIEVKDNCLYREIRTFYDKKEIIIDAGDYGAIRMTDGLQVFAKPEVIRAPNIPNELETEVLDND